MSGHREDCPAAYFTDRPERCRCAILAALDRRQRIERLRTLYLAVVVELDAALAEACPGLHIPRQHRDGKPPWCPECGRGRDGVQYRDVVAEP